MLQFISSPQETFLVLCQRWSCKNCSYCIDKILLYWNVAKEYGFSWQTTLLKWYKVGPSFTLLTLVAELLFYGEYFKRNSVRLCDPRENITIKRTMYELFLLSSYPIQRNTTSRYEHTKRIICTHQQILSTMFSLIYKAQH